MGNIDTSIAEAAQDDLASISKEVIDIDLSASSINAHKLQRLRDYLAEAIDTQMLFNATVIDKLHELAGDHYR